MYHSLSSLPFPAVCYFPNCWKDMLKTNFKIHVKVKKTTGYFPPWLALWFKCSLFLQILTSIGHLEKKKQNLQKKKKRKKEKSEQSLKSFLFLLKEIFKNLFALINSSMQAPNEFLETLWKSDCYGVNCIFANLYVEGLMLKVMVVRDEALGRKSNLDETKWVKTSQWNHYLSKKRERH